MRLLSPSVRALFPAAVLAVAGCPLQPTPGFGEPCPTAGACPEGLACRADVSLCLPPLPPRPPDVRGRSCAEPLALDLDPSGLLFAAQASATATEDNNAGAEQTCGPTRTMSFQVNVPPAGVAPGGGARAGMVLRISAEASRPIALSWDDTACAAEAPDACDARGTSTSLVVPLAIAGEHRVRVSFRDDGEDLTVRVRVEQLECPAGFLPDGEGCRGFVVIEGPTPRRGHAALATTPSNGVVIGGTAEDGSRLRTAAYFDRRFLSWRPATLEFQRSTPCAAMLPSGVLATLGGTAEDASIGPLEVARSDTGDFIGPEDNGTIDDSARLLPDECLAVPLFGAEHALVIGAEEPWILTDGIPPTTSLAPCQFSDQCGAGEACVARYQFGVVGNTGVCLCAARECAGSIQIFGSEHAGAPAALFSLRGGAALLLAGPPGSEVALILGGAGFLGPLASPYLFVRQDRLWVALPIELAARNHPLLLQLGEHLVAAGGFIGAATGLAAATAPATDLIEVFTLNDAVPVQGRLSAPRRDAAIGAWSDREALVMGGGDALPAPALATTDIVDAATGAVRAGPVLPFAVRGHRVIPLGDELLVVGGGGSDGTLLTQAALLVRSPRALDAPAPSGSVLSAEGGDSCADAAELVGQSGSIETTTFGHRNDLDGSSYPACDTSSPGLDSVFRVEAAAGETLRARLTPLMSADLIVYVLGSCPGNNDACIASADTGGSLDPEELEVVAPVDGPLFIVVDRSVASYQPNDSEPPYSYRLDWSIE